MAGGNKRDFYGNNLGKETSSLAASSPKLPGEEEHEFMNITSVNGVADNIPQIGIMNGNPYFVSTVKKKNQMHVPRMFMKEHGSKLGVIINIRDPFGRFTKVNIAPWKVRDTYLQGLLIVYELNHIREGDKFLCELVQGNGTKETYLQLHTNLLKFLKLREPTSEQDLKMIARAHASYGDDKDASEHVIKKHKGHSFDLQTPCGSFEKPKEQNTHEVELQLELVSPISPISLAISGEEGVANINVSGEVDLVNINGYKVKANSAPILKAIFAKYGDITTNCSYKSISMKASLLGVLCNTILTLQNSDTEAVLSNLEVIENEISDVEASKIEVTWLHDYLENFQKVAALSNKSLKLREDKVTSGIVTSLASNKLQQRRAELAETYERFREAEKLETAMKLVSENIEDKIMRLEAEKSFLIQGRLNELL